MSKPTTIREFLDVLEQSRLLAPERFERVRHELQAEVDRLGDAATAERAAKALMRHKILTRSQTRRLLAGKLDGYFIGKYKLLEVLRSGGMGIVFLAEQVTMERIVALKVLRPISDRSSNERLERFRREAKAVAKLRHANIIQAYDFDEESGVPCMVMEYAEGISVDQQVATFGPLDVGQACNYVCQAATGLQHAFEAGFVHRDIKPANLVVDRDGVLKLLDLGLVSGRAEGDSSLTTDRNQLGTVDYVAPEQAIDSRTVDIRADIYGLGASLYFMLSGDVLFPDRSITEKLLAVQTSEPRPLSSLRSEVPAEVVAIIEKMLAKKPDQRYATPDEVRAALAPFSSSKIPPYDLSAIAHTVESLQPFLGLAPSRSSDLSLAGDASSRDVSPPPDETPPAKTRRVASAPTSAQPLDVEPPAIIASTSPTWRKPRKRNSALQTAFWVAGSVGMLGLVLWMTGALTGDPPSNGETPQPETSSPAASPDSEEPTSVAATTTKAPKPAPDPLLNSPPEEPVAPSVTKPSSPDDSGPRIIAASEAHKAIGEHVRVRMTVRSVRYLPDRHMTFMNSEARSDSPGNFTLVLFGDDISTFAAQDIDRPSKHYKNKQLLVEGTIDEYRGKPQIHVTSPAQISVVSD